MKRSFLLLFILILGSYNSANVLAGNLTSSGLKDYFGPQTGLIHPFIGITGFYTDNVYNRHENTKNALGGVISPGIWMSFPHVKEPMVRVRSSTMTPGGISLKRVKKENFKRFQGFFSYRADIWRYDGEDKANKTEHFLTAAFQYNMPIGLTTEFLGSYIKAHDEWGETLRKDLSPYDSLFGGVKLLYDLSKRIDLRFDVRYFNLDYRERIDDYRDRKDFILSPYFYYKIFPKTSIFVQYKYLDITYDKNKFYDSIEHHFYGGVKWRISKKTTGELKGGYAIKDYKYTDRASYFVIIGRGDYKFNKKFWVDLSIRRQSEETPIYGYKNVVTNEVKLIFNYKLTGKTSFHLEGSYNAQAYDAGSGLWYSKDRDDDTYIVLPYLLWKFKPWMNVKLGYRFKRRYSSVRPYDYTNNSFWLTLFFTL